LDYIWDLRELDGQIPNNPQQLRFHRHFRGRANDRRLQDTGLGKADDRIREHENLILETARRLVKKAVNDLMRTHNIDRRTAQDWIKETVG